MKLCFKGLLISFLLFQPLAFIVYSEASKMRPLFISLISLTFFGNFLLGKCVYLSNEVSDSICEQHRKFTESGELQKAVKSGSGSGSDAENEGCGWYQVKKGKEAGCGASFATFIECRIMEQRQLPFSSSGENREIYLKPESGRIVGGEDAEPNEFPSLVELFADGDVQCGSSLISPEWVVTAAHCLGKNMLDPKWDLIAGLHKLSEKDAPAVQKRKIVAYQMNELYGSTGADPRYDIAVLKVAPPFELNEQVNLVTLPDPELRAEGVFTAAGWGNIKEGGPGTDILQKVEVPFVDDETCAAAYLEIYRNVTEDMICAGIAGKDTCQGDSGGPLYKMDGDKQILVGITSFGYGCAQPGFPGGYTEVAYFIDWIKKNTCME